MVYSSNGQVPEQSSGTLSFITHFFWGTVEFVILFFKISSRRCENKRGYRNSFDSRFDNGRRSIGNPPRRMGQINHLRGPSPPPMGGV
ncbi:selenoprotein K-like [Marmota marmota marmota]|uniref:Selenoprotein K n=1 Tax=Marmota marmota marmota TaxID=9994 RepID=A0A8C5YND4_MARMA|nr:selenoprotein K-like [Marmota marmota marmota]